MERTPDALVAIASDGTLKVYQPSNIGGLVIFVPDDCLDDLSSSVFTRNDHTFRLSLVKKKNLVIDIPPTPEHSPRSRWADSSEVLQNELLSFAPASRTPSNARNPSPASTHKSETWVEVKPARPIRPPRAVSPPTFSTQPETRGPIGSSVRTESRANIGSSRRIESKPRVVPPRDFQRASSSAGGNNRVDHRRDVSSTRTRPSAVLTRQPVVVDLSRSLGDFEAFVLDKMGEFIERNFSKFLKSPESEVSDIFVDWITSTGITKWSARGNFEIINAPFLKEAKKRGHNLLLQEFVALGFRNLISSDFEFQVFPGDNWSIVGFKFHPSPSFFTSF